MTIYGTSDIYFELPNGFHDQTTHILTTTEAGQPSPFNITVTRSKITPQDTLKSYTEKLIPELKKALPEFKCYTQKSLVIVNIPAIQTDYSWLNENKLLVQRQIAFIRIDNTQTHYLVQITATALENFSRDYIEQFNTILNTIKLR